MRRPDRDMRTIGVFYDGGYYQHVSNHYRFEHPVGRRISVDGLHRFLSYRVGELEGVSEQLCSVVEAHYFRGRYSAAEAAARDALYSDRAFEDALQRAGIQTHYLPLANGAEKGVDVLFALEAYEQALHKGLEVVVLFAGDGDYVPLVSKLAAAGVRVMVLGFSLDHYRPMPDGEHRDLPRQTRASSRLMEAAAYPLDMSAEVETAYERGDDLIDELFVPVRDEPRGDGMGDGEAAGSPGGLPAASGVGAAVSDAAGASVSDLSPVREDGRIVNLKDGYGFIKTEQPGEKNLFFFKSEVENDRFERLGNFTHVTFRRGVNERGECAVEVRCV